MKNILQKIQKLLIRFFKKLYIGMIFWGVYVILVCIFWILAKILIAQFGANWMNISIFWSSLLAFWLCLVFLKVFWKKIIHYFFKIILTPLSILFINENTNFGRIFLQRLDQLGLLNFKEIYSLYRFYERYSWKDTITIPDNELVYYKIPRKLHKHLDELNKNISRVLSGHYVNNFEELSENNFRVQVTKENKSYTEMKKTIIGIKDELVLHFKKYIKNPDLRIIGDYDKVL